MIGVLALNREKLAILVSQYLLVSFASAGFLEKLAKVDSQYLLVFSASHG